MSYKPGPDWRMDGRTEYNSFLMDVGPRKSFASH